jgi:selenocysteine lyase/cysteine desulfurase
MGISDHPLDLDEFKPSFISQSGQKERENFHGNMNLNVSTTEILDQLEGRSKVVVSARGKGIRISPHFNNIEQDIDRLILGLRRILRSE